MSGTEHKGYTNTEEGRSERSYLASAHNLSNSEQARMHAATEYAKLHEARTGEQIDPKAVMAEGEAKRASQ
ncbi:hypothetical protein DUNSADRAFT_14862 [Dunaliella salina]|uniref:Uncharacterized protein n=1 Tax=Dunaliella salina TaxID=3046 RepID=A0ABQ7G6J1_DUNSA|nr:hypothetical protein DUNSADRAFT_14862 [Dunaliella salina]|eukprot:KAF5830238.1 hypothetical protein DUNSADRAFT_14862 [Dunaliella salina]